MPVSDLAIDRNDVAATDQQPVARLDQIRSPLPPGRHCDGASPRAEHAPATATCRAAPAAPRNAFEILSARIHQRDDRGGEIFTDDKRRGHRQCGDDIEADPACTQALPDFDDKRDQNRERGRGPDRAGPAPVARQVSQQIRRPVRPPESRQEPGRNDAPAVYRHVRRRWTGPSGIGGSGSPPPSCYIASGPRPIATTPVRETSTSPSGSISSTNWSILSLLPVISNTKLSVVASITRARKASASRNASTR